MVVFFLFAILIMGGHFDYLRRSKSLAASQVLPRTFEQITVHTIWKHLQIAAAAGWKAPGAVVRPSLS